MAPQSRFGSSRPSAPAGNRFQSSRPPASSFGNNRNGAPKPSFGGFGNNDKPRSFGSSTFVKKPFSAPSRPAGGNFRDNGRSDRFPAGGRQQPERERRDFPNRNEDRNNTRQPSFESRRFERSAPSNSSFGSRSDTANKDDGAVLSITNVPSFVKEFEVRKFFEQYGQVVGFSHDGRVAKVKFSTQRQCSEAYQAEKGRLTFAGKMCDLSMPTPASDYRRGRDEHTVSSGFGHVDDNKKTSDYKRFDRKDDRERPSFASRRDDKDSADKRSFGKRTRSSSPRPSFEGRRDFGRDGRDRDYQGGRNKTRYSDSDNSANNDSKASSFASSRYDLTVDKPEPRQRKPENIKKGSEIPYPFRSVPEVVVFIEEPCYDRHMEFLRKKLIDAGFVFGTIKKSDPNIVTYAKKQLHAFAQRGTKIALAISQNNIEKKEFIDLGWKLMTTPGSFGDYIDTEMKDMTPFHVIKSLGGQIPSPFMKKGKKPKKEPELYPRPTPVASNDSAAESNDSADEITPEALDLEFGAVKAAAPNVKGGRRVEVVENHFGDFDDETPMHKKQRVAGMNVDKAGSNWPKQTKSNVQNDWVDYMNQGKANLQWAEWPKESKKTSKNNHLLWSECQVKPSSERPSLSSKSEKVSDPRRRVATSVSSSVSPPTPTPQFKHGADNHSADMSQNNALMPQMNPAQMQMLMMQMMMGQMNPQMGAMMEAFMKMQQQGAGQQSNETAPSFESQMSNIMAGVNPMAAAMGMGGYPNFGMDAGMFQPLGAASSTSAKNTSSANPKSVPTEGMEQVQLMNQLLKSMTSNQ